LKGVARQADTVLPMVRTCDHGPTRLMPFSRRVSAAQTWFALDAPPEPATRPVRGLETSIGCEAGVGDGLLHRHEGVGRRVAHEAHRALVDMSIFRAWRSACRRRGTAKALLGVFRDEFDARSALAQDCR
jgi:hypothetical protein